jgi:hypothetical protein
MKKVEVLKELETMLVDHDWFYSMSDDHRAFIKGRDESYAIQDKMNSCKKEGLVNESSKLYHKYAPKF